MLHMFSVFIFSLSLGLHATFFLNISCAACIGSGVIWSYGDDAVVLLGKLNSLWSYFWKNFEWKLKLLLEVIWNLSKSFLELSIKHKIIKDHRLKSAQTSLPQACVHLPMLLQCHWEICWKSLTNFSPSRFVSLRLKIIFQKLFLKLFLQILRMRKNNTRTEQFITPTNY